MNNIISEHLLNMDEWNLLGEGEGWDGKSSEEQQDTNRNSGPTLSHHIKIALDSLSSKTLVMLGEGTLLLTFKQQAIASQNR